MSEALGETLFQPCCEPSGLAPPAPLEVRVCGLARGEETCVSPTHGTSLKTGGACPQDGWFEAEFHAATLAKSCRLERQSGRSQHTFASTPAREDYGRDGLGEGWTAGEGWTRGAPTPVPHWFTARARSWTSSGWQQVYDVGGETEEREGQRPASRHTALPGNRPLCS